MSVSVSTSTPTAPSCSTRKFHSASFTFAIISSRHISFCIVMLFCNRSLFPFFGSRETRSFSGIHVRHICDKSSMLTHPVRLLKFVPCVRFEHHPEPPAPKSRYDLSSCGEPVEDRECYVLLRSDRTIVGLVSAVHWSPSSWFTICPTWTIQSTGAYETGG